VISVFWVLEQPCYIRLAGSENLKLTQVISDGAGDRNRKITISTSKIWTRSV